VLNIQNTEVQRIGPLAASPIREFDGDHAPITDLTVVSRWPLEKLRINVIDTADASHLRGLKLRWLEMSNVTPYYIPFDLAALKGMPLETFRGFGFTGLSLKPLEGAPLKELWLRSCKDVDLRILRGKALTVLVLRDTAIADTAPIRNLPLTLIDLMGTQIRDVSWLANCQTLESVVLPRGALGVEKLRHLPNLKRISYEAKDWIPTQSADEFWEQSGKQKKP